LLGKSFLSCISVGALSSDVSAALESQELIPEAMVRGGRFLGGDCNREVASPKVWNRLRRSAATVQIGLDARVGRG
jgi:hypothetical protein